MYGRRDRYLRRCRGLVWRFCTRTRKRTRTQLLIRTPPTGAFTFGRARGVIEGVVAAAGLPCSFLTSSCWKRTVGLTLASKDAARAEAIRRWPGNANLFARVKDDVLAEAALIAAAELLRKGANA